jgi:hypothetical protein
MQQHLVRFGYSEVGHKQINYRDLHIYHILIPELPEFYMTAMKAGGSTLVTGP